MSFITLNILESELGPIFKVREYLCFLNATAAHGDQLRIGSQHYLNVARYHLINKGQR